MKIIENFYNMRLKISRNNIYDLKSYLLTYNGIEYHFSNSN
jgi:hypothetical protein